MKTLKTIATMIMVSLLATSCSTTSAPRLTPPPPQKTESVIPKMNKIGDNVGSVMKDNTRISEKLKDQEKAMLDQKISIADALAQAEKMKEKAAANQAITEIDAIDMISKLKKVEDRNMFLETTNKELTDIKTEQEKTLNELNTKVKDATELLAQKETEVMNLRSQNKYYHDTLQQKNQETEEIKKELSKEKERAARANVYRNWIIGIAVGWVLWTIIRNVLMVYFPAVRFRV